MFSIRITSQIAIDHLQSALSLMECSKFDRASQSIEIAIFAFPETHRPSIRRISTCVADLKGSFNDRTYNRLRDEIGRAIELLQNQVNQPF